MNAGDMLKYGHQTVLTALEGIPDKAWETSPVVGVWTLKDLVAHLASFEQMLSEVLASLNDPAAATPTLEQFTHNTNTDFNAIQVGLRKHLTPAQAQTEYQDWHQQVHDLATALPQAKFRELGLLPWYGAEYDLEDFLVYTYYGHKREHSAQIVLFKKRPGLGSA